MTVVVYVGAVVAGMVLGFAVHVVASRLALLSAVAEIDKLREENARLRSEAWGRDR